MACQEVSCPTLDEVMQEIRSCHAKAVSNFADAITLDEGGDKAEATWLYLQALRYCEEGLIHSVHDMTPRGALWEDARSMQERMIITQGRVKERIYELQSVRDSPGQNIGAPPPYSVEDPFLPSAPCPTAPHGQILTAELLLCIDYGVQIYFVSAGDEVGAPPPSYPTTLRIIGLGENHGRPGDPEAILQVGDKVYPLVQNQMPILKSANGVYMFPNCTEIGIQRGSFGVVISQNVAREDVEKFESILRLHAAFCTENSDDGFVDLTEFVGTCSADDDYVPPNKSERIAASLLGTAEVLSGKLQKGTNYMTEAVERGSEKVKSNLSPASSKLAVSPYIKRGLEYSNEAAKVTVTVKNWLVDWLRQVASSVGGQLGPYLTTAVDSTSDNTKLGICGAMTVVSASLAGFGKIWAELEKAGSTIAKAVTSETVKNVEFKYGPDAGEAAGLALGAAVSIGYTVFTLDNIGATVIADMMFRNDSGKPQEPLEFQENHYKSEKDGDNKNGEIP